MPNQDCLVSKQLGTTCYMACTSASHSSIRPYTAWAAPTPLHCMCMHPQPVDCTHARVPPHNNFPATNSAIAGFPIPVACTMPHHPVRAGAASKSHRRNREPRDLNSNSNLWSDGGSGSWARARRPQINPSQASCGPQAASWTTLS